MRLLCPLVTFEVRVALAEDLPVSGVDFLLGNDLTGGRVWLQLPSTDIIPDEEAAEVYGSVVPVVAHPKARRAPRCWVPAGSVTPVVDCNKLRPPLEKHSIGNDAAVGVERPKACPAAGKGLDESESDLSDFDSSESVCCVSVLGLTAKAQRHRRKHLTFVRVLLRVRLECWIWVVCMMACLTLRSLSKVALRQSCHPCWELVLQLPA